METSPGPHRVMRIITRLNVGGPTRHVRLLMEGLGPRFDQLLVHGPGDPVEGVLEVPGARRQVDALVRRVRPLRDRRAWQSLRELMAGWRPAVVHTHQGKAGALGRLAARREGVGAVVHTYHGHTFRHYFGLLLGSLVREVEKAAARASHALVCQSPSQERDVRRFLGRAAEGRTRVIPPAIRAELFRAPAEICARTRHLLGGRPGRPVLLLPSRLVPVKRPLLALDVLESMRRETDARLWIAGEGPLRGALGKEVARRGLGERVQLLGNRTDMAALYGAADLVLLTSREEGTPLVLLEAMAAGTPVAAPAVGGVADLVGEAGLLLDPGEPPAEWGRHLLDLWADRRRGEALARKGRTLVETRHRPERLVADLQELYGELLGGSGGG